MGLAQQLVTMLTLLLFGVFGGSFALGVSQAKGYLDRQLGAHAQDTATALALSLGPYAARQDSVAVQSLVDAISDGGFFSLVQVENEHGRVLAQRTAPVAVAGVPAWFVNLIQLQTPVKEAALLDGWRVNGRVRVLSHPGYAYKQIWRDSVSTFWWFAAAWLLMSLLVTLLVRFALKPLVNMEAQAAAISSGEFRVLHDMPRTRELRNVVRTMNAMSQKVERLLNSKLELIRKIEQEAILDPLTGVSNRAHFESQLRAWLKQDTAFAPGALYLVRLTGLAQHNICHGYEAGNELLRQTARYLGDISARLGEGLTGRFSGTELVLAAPGLDAEEARLLGIEITQHLYGICVGGAATPMHSAHIGIGLIDHAEQAASSLFAEADMALRKAEAKSAFAWHVYERPVLRAELVLGASAWRRLLMAAMEFNGFRLDCQAAVSCVEPRTLHQEILARIDSAEGVSIPASVFMPMARRLQLAAAIDWIVIDAGLENMHALADGQNQFAFNLSLDSLRDPVFAPRLSALLRQHAVLAQRVIFEIPERALADGPAPLQELMTRITPLGVRFALDQAGNDATVLKHLKTMRFEYVKLAPAFVQELEQENHRLRYVQALCDLAHTVECQVIATGVETGQQRSLVCGLGLDAVQGKLIGAPEPMRRL